MENGVVWKVYVHINKINGKRYVGITSKAKPEHRWNSGRGYGENTHFRGAIQKYGWDNFIHIVLFDNLTELEAKTKECELIAEWDTCNPLYGYNMTIGGDGATGYHPSAETRAKLSMARRKENLSPETLARRSAGLRGRKFSEEHKAKIGAANSRAIFMLSSDGSVICEFDSMKQAEDVMGISHSHISSCCGGKRKTAGGYAWKYA